VIRLNRQIFVLPLVACLLLVPALASPATVAHEAQHAHHKAATHFSALCSWLCGAGQSIETSSIQLDSILQLLDLLETYSVDEVLPAVATLRFFRGPPAISK
jgi:hypothetical protein